MKAGYNLAPVTAIVCFAPSRKRMNGYKRNVHDRRSGKSIRTADEKEYVNGLKFKRRIQQYRESDFGDCPMEKPMHMLKSVTGIMKVRNRLSQSMKIKDTLVILGIQRCACAKDSIQTLPEIRKRNQRKFQKEGLKVGIYIELVGTEQPW